jgi:hypothetical protein
MSLASSEIPASVTGTRSEPGKSYDLKILVSVGVVLVGIVVAVVALTGHHGVSGADLSLMTAWP